MKVVLDTNFIFSVLGLHDNPGDDSALSLVEMARNVRDKLDIRFYVLPGTLEEAKRVLIRQVEKISRIRTTKAMARAAVTQPLPSVAKKFFDAAKRIPGLTAETFFQPYIDDLRTILQGKGIAVLEAHPAIYNQRQDVIDDVQDELSREELELPEHKRKGYETLLHDAVLWHAVRDRRKSDLDAPFEVEFWAVSIDWRLMAFDRKKRFENASRLPVVLHPSNLVQLIQFWVPRNKELDDSLVDALRLPLFFQSFDPEDERATVKVLESISRFENVEDLPEQTIKLVLANKVLRGRIQEADASNDEVFELVREELLEEHKKTVSQLEAAKSTALSSKQELEVERAERMVTEQERNAAEEALRKANAHKEEMESRISHEKAARELAEGHVKSLQDAINNQNTSLANIESRLERQRYIWLFVVIPLVIGGVASVLFYAYGIELTSWLGDNWAKWGVVLGIFLLPAALACLISPWYCSQRPSLLNWRFSQWVGRVGRKGILAPVLAASSAIFNGGVWDWVKALTGFNV
ncbi:hypothetical protein [Neopusillimonas aromaticivorans]|uniref:hypothetical protein n=1 Tax=Neopusillimonas aromaticivorans TaxID=2979868 RepID=UPI0025954ADF|nr:hypothetical protein [Neopusillimonas aromaticivorans]WJJ93755.1 hypothetical protein N7E01_00290 [Neopusillimonas aromaticivorans]